MNVWNSYRCLLEDTITITGGTTPALLSSYLTIPDVIPLCTIRLQIQSLGAGVIYHYKGVQVYTKMKQISDVGSVYTYQWKYNDLIGLYIAADNVTDQCVCTFEGPL